MARRDKIQKVWEDSIDLYATAAAKAAEAWAAAKTEISNLQQAERSYLWKIDQLKQFANKSEEIRHKLIIENNELREEILSLKEELQTRDNIIDRIAATKNPVLIAELVESEGA